MILSLMRTPTSYFRPYRNYFVAIYVVFIAFPLRELVLVFQPDEVALSFFTELIVVAAIIIAILWGLLATRLYLHPEPLSLRSILNNQSRAIQLLFLLYLIPMVVTFAASLLIPGTINTGSHAIYVFSNVEYRAVSIGSTFLLLASSVIVSFVGYPFFVLVRLRSQLKDPEVRSALRVIALSFGLIAILLFSVNASESFGYSVQGPGHLVSVALLIVVVRAFRRPSFLKAFLGFAPALESFPLGKRSDEMVLIYGGGAEKFGPISRYVSEGVNQLGRVIYFHYGEEENVREGLAHYGVNVKQNIVRGSLRLAPLGTLYREERAMDEQAAISTCSASISEARALGKASLRIVIDYGNNISKPSEQFVKHLTDTGWTSPDHFVKILMAFPREVFEGRDTVLNLLKSQVPVLEHSEIVNGFSRSIGLSHTEIMGKKILLEYDPSSDYDRVLRSLLAESASNFEPTVVFTRNHSPIRSLLQEEPGLKTFILTSRVSYPKLQDENLVLLPAYDTSLLLDAFHKTIDAYTDVSFLVIFDNISHYVFSLGPEKTLSLLRQCLELMISDKITAIFLINFGAHDQKIMSSFENLFDIELVCRREARALEVRKRLAVTP